MTDKFPTEFLRIAQLHFWVGKRWGPRGIEDEIDRASSKAAQRGYTHHELDVLKNAMSKSPSVNS